MEHRNDIVIDALLVEDNPADARLIADMLDQAEQSTFRIETVPTMTEAKKRIESEYDIVLLDLNLPDSAGLDSVDAVRHASDRVPIVVLTSMGSSLGVDALGHGAQDYLVKGSFDPRDLERAVLFAVTRHQNALRSARLVAEQARERSSLQRMEEASTPSGPLRERDVHLFTRVSQEFSSVIQDDLSRMAHDDAPRGDAWARTTASELAEALAGPRDVVDIYLAAVRDAVSRADTPEKREAAAQEARLRALELMGHLADNYRGARPGDELT